MIANHTAAMPSLSQIPFVPIGDATSLHLVRITRGAFIATAILFISLIAFGIFQIQARAQSVAAANASAARPASSGTVYSLAAGKVVPEVVPVKEAPIREVHIANTGLMLLRGATVISNSNGVIRVGMEWGSADFTWTLNTDSSTKYLTARGQKQAVEDIAVGDFVTVTGMLAKSGAEPKIDADYVREI